MKVLVNDVPTAIGILPREKLHLRFRIDVPLAEPVFLSDLTMAMPQSYRIRVDVGVPSRILSDITDHWFALSEMANHTRDFRVEVLQNFRLQPTPTPWQKCKRSYQKWKREVL